MTLRCQHIALFAHDLDAVARFYADILGVEIANRSSDHLALRLQDGFVFRYERSDPAPDTSGVRFVGFELDSFNEVDAMFERLGETGVPMHSDLREKYRHSTGPYGFVISDPAGWRIKLFKYNDPDRET